MKGWRAPIVTLLIIAVNVAVFIWQCRVGDGDLSFSLGDLYKMGANVAQLSVTGDGWRLLSALFLHQDLEHLAMNMAVLLAVGTLAEQQIGRIFYLFIYLSCGVLSNFVSAAWHFNDHPSQLYQAMFHASPIMIFLTVGASGAIYAIAGVAVRRFLTFNTYNELTFDVKNGALALFMLFGYSLFEKNIDHIAHISGFIFGVLISLPAAIYALHRCSRRALILSYVALALMITGAVGYNLSARHNDKRSDSVRSAVLEAMAKEVQKSADELRARQAKAQAEIDRLAQIEIARQEWPDYAADPAQTPRNGLRLVEEPAHSMGIEIPFGGVAKVVPVKGENRYWLLTNYDEHSDEIPGLYQMDGASGAILRTLVKVPFENFDIGWLMARSEGASLSPEEQKSLADRYNKEGYIPLGYGCGREQCFGSAVMDLAVSEDGATGYVASLQRQSLSRVDLTTGEITARIKLGEFPRKVQIDADHVYVFDNSVKTLFVLDRKTLEVTHRLMWGDDFLFDFELPGEDMAVASNQEDVYLINNYSKHLYHGTRSDGKLTLVDAYFPVLQLGRNSRGEVWVLYQDQIYYPQTGKRVRFGCMGAAALETVSTVAELAQGKQLVLSWDRDNNMINGYSAATGQLLRRWAASSGTHPYNDLFSLHDLHDGRHFLIIARNEPRIIDMNKSQPVSQTMRDEQSLPRYRCLTEQTQ